MNGCEQIVLSICARAHSDTHTTYVASHVASRTIFFIYITFHISEKSFLQHLIEVLHSPFLVLPSLLLSFRVQGKEIINDGLAAALQAAQQPHVCFTKDDLEEFNFDVLLSTEENMTQLRYIKGLVSSGDAESAVAKYFRPQAPRSYKKWEGQNHTGRNPEQSELCIFTVQNTCAVDMSELLCLPCQCKKLWHRNPISWSK